MFQSCDPYNQAYLTNKTGNDIYFSLQLDTTELKHYSAGPISFLHYVSNDSTTSAIELDTIKLYGQYKLKPKSSVLMSDGISISPNIPITYLEIINRTDTITYDTRNVINKAFKHISGSKYELVIE